MGCFPGDFQEGNGPSRHSGKRPIKEGKRRDIPAKSRDIPLKKFDFPGFEGHTELFGPHPFVWKTPTPPENIWAQKFGFGFVFRA